MNERSKRAWIDRFAVTGLLALTSFALAFWQRPHGVYSDTRVEMVTRPGLFLERIASLWTPTIDLGHIQTSQFVGYLFPMGPIFALGDLLGLPPWFVQRLWIGLLLAAGAWGVVRLVESLRPSTTRTALFLAGLIYVTSPFVTVSLNRGTIWLIPYALLPWMLLVTSRGIRRPTGWMAPAALALLVAACSAGVTPLVWLIAAVALLGVFEAITGTGLRPVVSFAWRAALLSFVASLWWIVPVLVQARYGTDYLTFTEHPEAILHTPSASESIRLLGYWVGYVNGYPDTDPQLPAMSGYLLSPLTVAMTFLLPALAIASVALMRRWRYAPFFGLMLALSVLAMSFGFPQESRLGAAVTDLYYGAGPFQFLRTTYKAAPLVGLSTAILAGILLGTGVDRLRRLRFSLEGRRVPAAVLWVPAALLVTLIAVQWGRPLWAGNSIDSRLMFDEVPRSWVDALDEAQSTTPADTRIAVLPGELFAWYRWAGLQNSLAPGLSEKPVVIRQIVRSSPPLAAQLLDSVDAAVQLDRLTPDQLPPLLRLMGVGRVLVPSDSSPDRNEALDPARAATVLSGQPGFQKPAATFGPALTFSPPADRSGPSVSLNEVRAYAAPSPAAPRITRVHPAAGASIVDGDADGIVGMAAVGALDPERASFYAGDMSAGEISKLLPERPTLVFTDSNRRNFLLASRIGARTGQTLSATEEISREFPVYDPFPKAGTAGRTVAVYGGIRGLSAPASPGFTIFPEHRPFAALDGDPSTAWIAQTDVPEDRWMQVDLARPLHSGAIFVKPHMDGAGATRLVAVSVNSGAEQLVPVGSGWNRITLGAGPVNTIRIRVISRETLYGRSPAGLDEIRIPGVKVTEALRLPTDLAGDTAGSDLSGSPMQVVLERVTADFPRRSGRKVGPAFSLDTVGMADAESGMRRIVTLPAARSFTGSGWASLRPQAADSSIDELVGMGGGSRYESSSRWEGLGAYRASSAFDGNPDTAWAAEYDPGQNPWIEWQGSSPVAVRSLRLREMPGRFLRPTRVNVGTPNGGFNVPVQAGGRVTLPTTVTTSRLRVTVISVRRIPNARKLKHRPRAVALSEVEVAGVPTASPRRTGSFGSSCGAIGLRSRTSDQELSVSGKVEALDNGGALRMATCGDGGNLGLRRGANLVEAMAGAVFAPDHLLLAGEAPGADPAGREYAGITPGGKVNLDGPGWLVLGQSFSTGWKAWCRDSAGNERQLGEPVQADGFANGWKIDGAGCRSARFAFGPQRYANVAYGLSGIALLAMAALLLGGYLYSRRRGASPPPTGAGSPKGDEVVIDSRPDGTPLMVVRSAVSGTTSQGTGQLVARVITATSAVLVLAVGGLYVANPDPNPQGINFDYPLHHVAGHYVALMAMLLLTAGTLIRIVTLVRERAQRKADG